MDEPENKMYRFLKPDWQGLPALIFVLVSVMTAEAYHCNHIETALICAALAGICFNSFIHLMFK